jgi:hypothetical protein
MQTKFLVVVAIGALATIAMGQSQNTNIPTPSEAHSQSLNSHDTFVPSRDAGNSPTSEETKVINSVSNANNAASSSSGSGSGTSGGQSNNIPPQAVSDDTVKSINDDGPDD